MWTVFLCPILTLSLASRPLRLHLPLSNPHLGLLNLAGSQAEHTGEIVGWVQEALL